jgi:hypothetical protein
MTDLPSAPSAWVVLCAALVGVCWRTDPLVFARVVLATLALLLAVQVPMRSPLAPVASARRSVADAAADATDADAPTATATAGATAPNRRYRKPLPPSAATTDGTVAESANADTPQPLPPPAPRSLNPPLNLLFDVHVKDLALS